MPKPRLIFRISYNSLYVFLCLLLAALILVSPADVVQQAFRETYQYWNIAEITFVLVVTVLIVLFVYSLRLYVTRTVLAGIPKNWIPIEKGDLAGGKAVHEMIVRELSKSAAIAWAARPKIHDLVVERDDVAPGRHTGLGLLAVVEEDANDERRNLAEESRGLLVGGKKRENWAKLKKKATVEAEMGIALPPTRPVWGEIEHAGWGSPNSSDLANLHYNTVLAELPNLIEAKAVSQAPPDPDVADGQALHPEAVDILQRGTNMGLREYVVHLTALDVVPVSQETADFVAMYELARFSTRPTSNSEFRELMRLFADLLRIMRPLDPGILRTMRGLGQVYADSDGDVDDDGPRDSTRTTSVRSTRSMRSSFSLRSQASNGTQKRTDLSGRKPSAGRWPADATAPNTAKTRARKKGEGIGVGRSPSTHSGGSVVQSKSYTPSIAVSEKHSVRSEGSTASGGGSVIRLARHEGENGGLPYVLGVGDGG